MASQQEVPMKHLGLPAIMVVCGFLAAPAIAVAADAEYAIRWDPSKGGPKSAAETMAALTLDTDESHLFKVRYAVLQNPRPSIKAILRERIRTDKPRFELTYKLRSASPLPKTLKFTDKTCPAGAATEKVKGEVDVSFSSKAAFAHAFSLSCTVRSEKATPSLPPPLRDKFAPCTSTMTRVKGKALTVEEWHLAGGHVAIEVSLSGKDSKKDRNQFRDQVVKPLVDVHKIVPLNKSMTEMASNCNA
jgi:hypothetical protein